MGASRGRTRARGGRVAIAGNIFVHGDIFIAYTRIMRYSLNGIFTFFKYSPIQSYDFNLNYMLPETLR